MVIKNKDGSVFKLRGPNPVMKSQKKWNVDKLKFINMSQKADIVEDKRNPVEQFKENHNVLNIGEELGLVENQEETSIISGKDFLKNATQSEEPEIEVEIEEPKPTLDVDPSIARILKERGAEYWCAPVVGEKEYTDDLYGETHKTYQYGDSYIFDAILIDESDLELHIWCTRKITIGSIIYKKVKQGGERWWRINNVEPKTGGYLARAVVSDSNPSFS